MSANYFPREHLGIFLNIHESHISHILQFTNKQTNKKYVCINMYAKAINGDQQKRVWNFHAFIVPNTYPDTFVNSVLT